MRRWAERWPMIFGGGVTLGWVAMTLALSELPPHPFWGPVYVNAIGFVAGLLLLRLLGWGRAAGLERMGGGLLVVPILLLLATEAWPGLRAGADEAVILVFVGLNEELWSRGVILTALRGLGPFTCAWGVAALFGLQHLSNLWWGQALDDTLVQIVDAAAFGFVLASLRLRGVSLWWLVLTHAFVDYVSIMSPGAPPGWQQVAVILAEVGYGLWNLSRLSRTTPRRTSPTPSASIRPPRDSGRCFSWAAVFVGR